jgi:glycosyltransferase involved in cell wall biosynthesis
LHAHKPLLLDVTRLTSRLGRGALTGIDRVELAYLQYFCAQSAPVFGLLRTRFGFLLLDRAGLDALAGFAGGAPLPQGGRIARLFDRAHSISALRPHAIARCPHFAAAALMASLPQGTQYFNVGHSNLLPQLFAALRRAGLRSTVLIHDTIPLDYPHLCRPRAIPAFAAKLRAVALGADCVIHISNDARAKTESHFAAFGRVPQGVTAHLGLTLPRPTPCPHTPPTPYFIALGTIEPRKNHQFLLDIWDKMGTGPNVPHLMIIGNAGWAAPQVFAQIAELSARGTVSHFSGLSDGEVAHLIRGAAGLLFPTLAEGFGLPPLEAACIGIPAIVSDIPVLRETCDDFAVYLDPLDSYSWMETIQNLTQSARAGTIKRDIKTPPAWADHFKAVFTSLG